MESLNPCMPSPCGTNTECNVQQNAGSCSCLANYIGNPYEGCRPECVLNSDCPSNLACIGSRCTDPCPGTCGQNARCHVLNHSPTCLCIEQFTGNPLIRCQQILPLRKNLLEVHNVWDNLPGFGKGPDGNGSN